MIIDGKALAQNIKDGVRYEIKHLNAKPKFLIVQVGNNDASNVYVRNKIKACEYCGIEVTHLNLTESLTTEQIRHEIITRQRHYDAVMVQLPLPKHLNEDRIINAIDPNKDVDGLTDVNVGRLWNGKDGLFPCTALGVVELIKSVNFDLTGKRVCVIGRSKLVGKPLIALLQRENCTVTSCNSFTPNLSTRTAYEEPDIVVTAIGKSKNFECLDFNSGQTIIDVGINRDENGNLCGDVNLEDVVAERDVNITPVPGGVGPMTVAMLIKNIWKAYSYGRKK